MSQSALAALGLVGIEASERCLLSDRGFSSPIPEDKHLVFDFNLRSDAFVREVISDRGMTIGPNGWSRIMVR